MSERKVALITGSGKRRVGWHIAQALAARGYALAIHYRSSAAEARQTVAELRLRGAEAEPFCADLADERAIRDMVQGTLAHFGRIDVLVNAAARSEEHTSELQSQEPISYAVFCLDRKSVV